jgi:hypothetical protein
MAASHHDHVFGQDQPRPDERRTVVVTAIMRGQPLAFSIMPSGTKLE